MPTGDLLQEVESVIGLVTLPRAPGEISQMPQVVLRHDHGIDVCDDHSVHFISIVKRSLAIFDDVRMVEVTVCCEPIHVSCPFWWAL